MDQDISLSDVRRVVSEMAARRPDAAIRLRHGCDDIPCPIHCHKKTGAVRRDRSRSCFQCTTVVIFWYFAGSPVQGLMTNQARGQFGRSTTPFYYGLTPFLRSRRALVAGTVANHAANPPDSRVATGHCVRSSCLALDG